MGRNYEWNCSVSQPNTLWWNIFNFFIYCKPSIRLSALMGLRVIYIFSHDSIGLGEDGPTHQPIEHLSGLESYTKFKCFQTS